MLPRQHRLARDRDIRRVLQSRTARRGRFLHVRGVRREAGPARLTVVVSTRVAKHATVRNRLRRQIRSLIAERLGVIPVDRDYLVRVVPQTPLPSREELRRDLDHIFPQTPGHA